MDESSSSSLYPVSMQFVALSKFVDQVISKRIEQLAEVAMVDRSGLFISEILITPKAAMMNSLGITISDLENAIRGMQIKLEPMVVRDGQYQFNIRFDSGIHDKNSIKDIYIFKNDKLIQLKEIADVIEHPKESNGMVRVFGKDVISLAIIKRSDVQMDQLRKKLQKLIVDLKNDYPHLMIDINKDQTKLLDHSINNLVQSLYLGAIFSFLILLFFLKDIRAAFLVFFTIPASLLISLLLFYVIGLSINLISLSGLAVGIGIMIDNSIIVIDNITQKLENGNKLNDSCSVGASEIFKPLFSSVLTTCAVFLPLIFLSGLSGALFYDQAIAITISLSVSLLISMTVLPVMFSLVYREKVENGWTKGLVKVNSILVKIYEAGFLYMMRNQALFWIIFVSMLICTLLLFIVLPKAKLPQINRTEELVHINWNEPINVNENKNRVEVILSPVLHKLLNHLILIGDQQFVLNSQDDMSTSECIIFIETASTEQLNEVRSTIRRQIQSKFPPSNYRFEKTINIFDQIFKDQLPPLQARIRYNKSRDQNLNLVLDRINSKVMNSYPDSKVQPLQWKEYLSIYVDQVKMKQYDLDYSSIHEQLKIAVRGNEVIVLNDGQARLPVVIGAKPKSIQRILHDVKITNRNGIEIPLNALVNQRREYSLKSVHAGPMGEYIPINLEAELNDLDDIIQTISNIVAQEKNIQVDFVGSLFSTANLQKELIGVLLVSLVLLYCILAAQFESILLPLIVLIEVPIDLFGAFLMLIIFGSSINIMSLIGIIIMSGIIINDSILKIDTIIKTKRIHGNLVFALMIAGRQRLKAIVMTSVTTILALTPFLFIQGLGGDIQKPLALTVIGGMIIGSFVSLYFIPLGYCYLDKQTNGS